MKSVTIRAVRRIPIPSIDRFPMDAFRIPIVIVAYRARFDYPRFVTPPGCNFMDLHMAVRAPHIIDEVGAGIVFGPLDLVASVAGDWLGLDFPALCRVFLDISDIPVAAITGIGTVDRLGEFGLIDSFMALQAF
ncbi:MAG: hypothetical protein GTO13_07100 [Proteobacteria bacterium]|nr:hypothetical protein [Pseudomonadota bacterium]